MVYHYTTRNQNKVSNKPLWYTTIPQEIKTKSLTNRGDLAIINNGPIHYECIKFLDGKPVYMLSTVYWSDLSAICQRDKDINEIIMKPNMVVDYNKYMGGVDTSDQMISYTNSIVKSFKWWKKVIFVLAIRCIW